MSIRDVIRNATPEHLKAPVSSGNFYKAMEAMTETIQALKKRVEAMEKREKDAQQKALLDRIQALEEGGIRYRGVHQRAQNYHKGDVVTCKGDSWIALRSIKETEEPGKCDGWQLMAKAGKEA